MQFSSSTATRSPFLMPFSHQEMGSPVDPLVQLPISYGNILIDDGCLMW